MLLKLLLKNLNAWEVHTAIALLACAIILLVPATLTLVGLKTLAFYIGATVINANYQ